MNVILISNNIILSHTRELYEIDRDLCEIDECYINCIIFRSANFGLENTN